MSNRPTTEIIDDLRMAAQDLSEAGAQWDAPLIASFGRLLFEAADRMGQLYDDDGITTRELALRTKPGQAGHEKPALLTRLHTYKKGIKDLQRAYMIQRSLTATMTERCLSLQRTVTKLQAERDMRTEKV